MPEEVVVVAGQVSVDTGQATKSIKDLKDEVKNLQKEFENTKNGTSAQQEAFSKLKSAQDELAATTKNLQDTTKDLGGHFTTLKNNMGSLGTPLKTASEGVGKLSESFTALLANPVVLVIAAIVAGLAFLYKAFTNTFEGGQKMEQVFAGIKAAAGAVLDSIFNLGGAIIKFFSGDFKGAFEQAKTAITGVVDAATNAYNAVSKLTAQAQQLRKEQAANDIDQAKRAKDLAILREQATDPEIEVGKRKAALLELQKAAKEDAIKDVDLARRTAENKIALLSIGTDAAKKNFAEIAQIRVEQIRVETDAANEQRRIGKQITAANREELAQQKADADKAKEEAKKRREELEAFNSQLNKIQQENALAQIRDGYAKEKQILENKIADEQNLLKKEFEDGKITRDQFNQLQQAEQINANNQRQQLTDKHNEEVKANELKFQNELRDIREKIAVESIINQNEKEQTQLSINHQKALEKAAVDYKNDADKLFQIKQAIDADYQQQKENLDAKHKAEQDKKDLEESKTRLENELTDRNISFQVKQDAIDSEQAQFKAKFDAKLITEKEYNDEVKKLNEARSNIRKTELEEINDAVNATVDLLGAASEALGKNTAAGKALAIAAATIKALQAEVTIIANLSEVGPFGFVAGIAAAAAVGIGLFNTIKQIESTPIPGQSSGSSSTAPHTPLSVAAPIAPTQSSTQLPQAQIDQIGQQRNVRAYVIDQDNQAAANRAARLQGASVLGGH